MTDPSIILDIEPDWSVEPEVTYSFDTAIQPTPYLGEQRRPIRPAAVRTANYKFMDTEEIIQRLRYTLLSAKAEQVCVPLFNEPIFANSIVTGGSSITASTDLTYLWNIHNCSYVVLIDINTGQSEMLAVTSVSGQLIRFATNIVQTWVAAQTVIYPAMAASLTSLKENGNTDSVGAVETEFEEIALGAEATGDWVGLDTEECCEEVSAHIPTIIDDMNFTWLESDPGGYGTWHGPAYRSLTPNVIYTGDKGSNGRVDEIFYPSGTRIIQFDFYHHDYPSLDWWTTDDYGLAQVHVAFVPVGFAYHTINWHFQMPYYRPAGEVYAYYGPQLQLHLHKQANAKVSVTKYDPSNNWSVLNTSTISGLRTAATDYNTYRFEVNFNSHVVTAKVNGTTFMNRAAFGSDLDSSFAGGFQMIIHSHKANFGVVYFKNVMVG